MVYGSSLALPSAFLDARVPPSVDFLQKLRFAVAAVPAAPTNAAAVTVQSWMNPALQACTHVWIRRDGYVKPLEALYDGPFLVMGRSDKVFDVQVGTKLVSVSVDRLKPVQATEEITVQQPRRRGRPPGQQARVQPEPQRRGRPPKPKTTGTAVLGGKCAAPYKLRSRCEAPV